MAIFERNPSPILHWSESRLESNFKWHWKYWRQKIRVSLLSIKMFLVINLAIALRSVGKLELLRSAIGNFQSHVTWYLLWRLYHDFSGLLVFVVSQFGCVRNARERYGNARERYRNAWERYDNGTGNAFLVIFITPSSRHRHVKRYLDSYLERYGISKLAPTYRNIIRQYLQ